jgi:hypothetical protein
MRWRHEGTLGREGCYALSDIFALKLKTLEAMTLQSLHRARSSVGA